jgi:DNA repair protein RecO (recombination protein O)
MLTKTEAIVLRSIKYGDARVIVDLFTRRHGRVPFIVSIPRSPKARIKKQYFQPMTLLTVEFDLRPQTELQKLHDVSLLTPLPSLYGDAAKLALSLFTAEFLSHALRDEQQNEPLFSYIASSIEWLDGSPAHFANFHLVFLMRLSRFLGFYPNLEVSGEAYSYFDLRSASFCTAPPLHHDFLMPQEASHIRLLMRMDFATMHLFRLSRAERNRILELLLHYYRLHLPDFPELRSVQVLQELFE